ncbi:hypothetical protein C0584_00475 [Candidatus Parcubacteria bacterium]|nr:MAG: hypothetical protein C0584_00475 [Candidatus Parcubacteria bacterium]
MIEERKEEFAEKLENASYREGSKFKRISENLEVDYGSLGRRKESIIEALIFWSVVRQFWFSSIEQRFEVLKNYTESQNEFISVIALLESLPTMVFRRVLWKFNIDFMSDESFLRRITKEQKDSIWETYTELFSEKKVPSIFGFWKKLFSRISIQKLLADDSVNGRYERKGMMSYNLLNLDFGFNAYPGGVSDDSRIVEISPLRFMSFKNHADDFIVDKEFGLYWWLYRAARSNYVWFPNREVYLSTHVCPGFWYTLFIHFIFWILSPATVIAVQQGLLTYIYHEWNIVGFLLGLVAIVLAGILTPLWSLLAVLKLLASALGIMNIVRSFGKSVNAFCKKYDEFLGAAFTIGIITAVIYVGYWALYFGHHFFYPAFGHVGSVYVTVALLTWLLPQLTDNGQVKVKDFHWLGKVIVYPVAVYAPIRFMVDYAEEVNFALTKILFVIHKIDDFIIFFAKTFWEFCVFYGWALFILFGPLILMMILIFAGRFIKISEERAFQIYDRIAFYFVPFLTLVMIVYLVLLALSAQKMGYLPKSMGENLLLAFMPVLLLVALYFVAKKLRILNPVYKEVDDISGPWQADSSLKIDIKLFLQNQWFLKQDEDTKRKFIREVVDLTYGIFEDSLIRKSAQAYLAKMSTQSRLDTLFDRQGLYAGITDEISLGVIRMVSQGEPCNKKTLKKVKEEVRKVNETFEKVFDFLKILAKPFVWLYEGFVFVLKVLKKVFWEYPITLWRLYDQFFNKTCPYVAESGTMKMND